jgi:cytochrome c556
MRYLLCLLIGLLAGAVLASTAASALQRRNAVPRALMTLMQHDLAAARGATHSAGCTVDELPETRASLQYLAGELERTVLAPGARDRVFVQYADDLRATISRWDPEGACTAQAQALVDVGNACKACHRDYR